MIIVNKNPTQKNIKNNFFFLALANINIIEISCWLPCLCYNSFLTWIWLKRSALSFKSAVWRHILIWGDFTYNAACNKLNSTFLHHHHQNCLKWYIISSNQTTIFTTEKCCHISSCFKLCSNAIHLTEIFTHKITEGNNN